MLKVGVVGCGHLGKIHIKLLSESKNYFLVGVYDPNLEESKIISEKFNCTHFKNFNELLDNIDVLDIVTPTPFHFEYAELAINKKKHVFIEKPVCSNTNESNKLIELSRSNNVKIQVEYSATK